MAAASAATGFRSWLQTHNFSWLTPSRLRGLTIGAMCAAGLISTIGFSGSTPSATAHTSPAKTHLASPPGATIRHTSALR
jgi:hypothetical protein